MLRVIFLVLTFLGLSTNVLAVDKVLVKVVVPGEVEIKSGERIRAMVMIEAGEAKISAVDLKLTYDSAKFSIERVGVSGSEITSMVATATEGVINLAGGVIGNNLPSGTINFGFIDILAKADAKINLSLEQMEVVGYPFGSSAAGVVSEYVGVMAGGCKKAKLDLSGSNLGVADGDVNTLDYSLAKTRALGRASVASGGELVADFNGDCMENMADLGLVIREIILKLENQ